MKPLTLSLLLLAAVTTSAQEARPHRFWDNANRTLFISAVVNQTYDAATTRYVLDTLHASYEQNPFARPFEDQGTAGTVAFHYGVMTAGPLMVSYWLHRKRHHSLERLPLFFSI